MPGQKPVAKFKAGQVSAAIWANSIPVKNGGTATILKAKLIPQEPDYPFILAGFSPLLPEAENYAKRIHWPVEECIFMHEPFFVTRRVHDIRNVMDYMSQRIAPKFAPKVHV